jgi:hypothetical protein
MYILRLDISCHYADRNLTAALLRTDNELGIPIVLYTRTVYCNTGGSSI